LSPRELAHVHEIWLWREKEAKRADRPPFKILGNQTIIDLALWAARNPGAVLGEGPALPKNCVGGRLAGLERAIVRAHGLSESKLPQPRKSTGIKPDFGPHLEVLRKSAVQLAAQLEIDPAVLAPRKSLEAIALARPDSVELIMSAGGLMRWQAELIFPLVKTMSSK